MKNSASHRLQSAAVTDCNTPWDAVPLEDMVCIARAKNHILRLYQRFGSFRRVGEKLGINQRWPSEIARGVVPHNPEIRRKLGLPRRLPSEREPLTKKPIPILGAPGWEKVFFKRLMPHAKKETKWKQTHN